MALKVLLLLLATTSCMACTTSASREVPQQLAAGYNLTARLVATGTIGNCLNALTEIKSCTNEIVVFFTNGTADIGAPCCKAIGTMTRQCWPAMLTALGFTADECNILRGYCDASPAPSPSVQPLPPPPPSPPVKARKTALRSYNSGM
ncbi:hypothetical protein RJ640_012539 [Escallonia rubra]|uniref:Prolamin-like domain-containing protein n=1 Tax=Escallonia rubra TaxID=112253 RepID=A0AA88SMK2_9ASTE|nr:hypothetical protein RJ640_012539 [Escallonia rubra]